MELEQLSPVLCLVAARHKQRDANIKEENEGRVKNPLLLVQVGQQGPWYPLTPTCKMRGSPQMSGAVSTYRSLLCGYPLLKI